VIEVPDIDSGDTSEVPDMELGFAPSPNTSEASSFPFNKGCVPATSTTSPDTRLENLDDDIAGVKSRVNPSICATPSES
jgi:hypothetical protein